MAFLATAIATPLVMTMEIWNVVMSTIMIVLSVLLVLSYARHKRLLMSSAETVDVKGFSQAVTEETSKALRKRRTHGQKKQRRIDASSKRAISLIKYAKAEESDSPVIRESTDEEIDAEVGFAKDGSENELSSEVEAAQGEIKSINSEIGQDMGNQKGSPEKKEASTVTNVPVPDQSLSPQEGLNLVKMFHSSTQLDIGEDSCSCANTCAWGCARHAMYSRNLLLAHSPLNRNSFESPPGLELASGAAEASSMAAKKIIFAARL